MKKSRKKPSLSERESARRLARLGGTQSALKVAPRRRDLAALTITVAELRAHFWFIVDAILPIEEMIYVTRRGRVRCVLVSPELFECMAAGARAFDPVNAQGKRSPKVPAGLANYLALFSERGK